LKRVGENSGIVVADTPVALLRRRECWSVRGIL